MKSKMPFLRIPTGRVAMTDIPTVIHLKYALNAVREQLNARLGEIEAILDKELPTDDSGTDPRIPQSYQARKKYYRDYSIRATFHGRSVSGRRSKPMKTKGRKMQKK
ncbi:MAG: hypothetical protein KQI81_14120 [Deltaproteobacteria bacterium]|nr:hypothetical protein [Deltaproteobacteria bacterium]